MTVISVKPTQSIYRIAADYLPSAQFVDTFSYVARIVLANPQIVDWTYLPPGTKIILP